MPFTCDACGHGVFPELLPAVADVLRCPHCGHEREFRRPPLLVVAGTAGVGKSTVCARLAGSIPGAIVLDADLFAEDLVSVVGANADYPAFWRSLMRLAHEVAQNGAVVVYFAVMLPEQVLANIESLDYFSSVQFLCLTCPPGALRERFRHREGHWASEASLERWTDFNAALAATARAMTTATIVDAGGPIEKVTEQVRAWIETRLQH